MPTKVPAPPVIEGAAFSIPHISRIMATLQKTRLELRTAYGPVYRDVLPNPPRDSTREEIPVLDLDPMYQGDLAERKTLAEKLRQAAEGTGFFCEFPLFILQ